MTRTARLLGLSALTVLLAGAAAAADEPPTLSETPPIQGESWLGGAQQIDPTLGERRTDKQRNAVETKRDGTTGRIPDAGSGDSGLKDGTPPPNAGTSGGTDRGAQDQPPP